MRGALGARLVVYGELAAAEGLLNLAINVVDTTKRSVKARVNRTVTGSASGLAKEVPSIVEDMVLQLGGTRKP